MTQPDIWTRLAEPFPPEVVRERPGPGNRVLHYIDARIVAQRLDDVLTPAGWNFTCSVIPGTDIVKGRLEILSFDHPIVREDHGYPNSDRDEEPIKAATSDALKRCAVLLGIGRHLYDDNSQRRTSSPARPSAPLAPSGGAAGRVPPRPAAPTTPPAVEPEWVRESMGGNEQTVDNRPLKFGEFRSELEIRGMTLAEAGQVAKRQFGHSMIKDLSDEQRGDLFAELVA